MSDIIHVLPDSIANQIAAGEVIQRPASVVKELVENSVDAGATAIAVHIRDAGRTLVRIVDNGKGMSETDARLAFERHATSKIRVADDLFTLRTMGFRGEALASVAAVAQVEITTRRPEDEVGTRLLIEACQTTLQEHTACPVGTDIQVKNLFYNVPARRKFLKSNPTELRQIMQAFVRIALVYPDIEFTLYHNDTAVYVLRPATLKSRIASVFGKKVAAELIDVEERNELVTLHGFVATPTSARRKDTHNYFFVNGRYMIHNGFSRAVLQAYDRMLPQAVKPDFFLYFEVAPDTIDVNVHPTKTEIKFENESILWPILVGSVKAALGKFGIKPALDFEGDGSVVRDFVPSAVVTPPTVRVDETYNPFDHSPSGSSGYRAAQDANTRRWDMLYDAFNRRAEVEDQPLARQTEQLSIPLDDDEALAPRISLLYFRQRYILAFSAEKMLLIDPRRAHIRILYERYMSRLSTSEGKKQALLFPEQMELSATLAPIVRYAWSDLTRLGFELREIPSDEGYGAVEITAVPTELASLTDDDPHQKASDILSELLAGAVELEAAGLQDAVRERVAVALSERTAIRTGAPLSEASVRALYDDYIALGSPRFGKSGEVIATPLSPEDFASFLS